MKKFLSIFLTLCLMLTVVAVPLPAMAETSNKFVQNFDSYTPNSYIKWSGRVQPLAEPGNEGNTVIQFNNNGIPYQSEAVAKSAGYSNSGLIANSAYTAFAATDLGVAAGTTAAVLKPAFEAAIADGGYANYYNVTANDNNYKSTTTSFTSRDSYNSIQLNQLEVNTTYRITINYKRISLENALYVQPATWAASANQRGNTTSYNDARITIPATNTSDDDYVTVSTVFTTPEEFKTTTASNGTVYTGDVLRLILFTGVRYANNVVYFDNITVEKYIGSVTYNVGEGASVNDESVDSSYVVDYYGDDTPVFPTVTYSDGRTVTHWTDDNSSDATVDGPELNGSYTAVTKEPVEMVTITLNRGHATQEVEVEKGSEYTLPDTEFTDTSWWNHATPNAATKFVGYEGEKVVVNGNVEYHTTEGYTSTNVYRNWTGTNTTTEDFSYFYKTETANSENPSEWTFNGGSRVATRLGVVEDGNTYRISVTYKANTDADINFHMTTSSITNGGGTARNYLEDGKAFHVVKAGTNIEDWTTATFYVTADLPAEVTANNDGLDDAKDFDVNVALYLSLGKEEGYHNVEISIKETMVVDLGKVVEVKGASVLTDQAAAEAGKQAMRYYFDYKTAGDGTTITIDGTDYDVVERGFLYTNGDIEHYATAGIAGTSADQTGKYFVCGWGNKSQYGIVGNFMMWLADAKKSGYADKLTYRGITEGFENNWALDNGTVTFSTYVTGIKAESYSAKMMVRGYVIFKDENDVQHIVYSETVNRSVQGIKDALDAGNAGNNSDHDE